MRGIRLKIALGLISLFTAGIVVGAVGATFFIVRKVERSFEQGPLGVRNLILDGMQRQLKLSSEQRVKISDIVERAQLDIAVERLSVHDAIRARLDKSYQELQQQLSPSQQVLAKPMYEKMITRYESMKKLAESRRDALKENHSAAADHPVY